MPAALPEITAEKYASTFITSVVVAILTATSPPVSVYVPPNTVLGSEEAGVGKTYVLPMVPLPEAAHDKFPEPSFVSTVLAAPCDEGNEVVILFILTILPVEFTWNWEEEPTEKRDVGLELPIPVFPETINPLEGAAVVPAYEPKEIPPATSNADTGAEVPIPTEP